MKRILMALLALLVGCAGPKGDIGALGPQGPQGPQGPGYTPPTVDSAQADIDSVLKEENDYRTSLGQSILSEGLSCSVQQVVSGQCLSAASVAVGCNAGNVISTTGTTNYAYLYKGLFNQPDTAAPSVNGLLPTGLQSLFTNVNYVIKCNGYMVVTETNYYDFSLNSDDGSILTITGGGPVNLSINNDNNHGMTVKTGSAILRRGVRAFNLQYAQTGGGNFGLILLANGSPIQGKYYAH
jgi:hypothetical protein